MILYRWILELKRPAMTTRNNCSILKGIVHYLSFTAIIWVQTIYSLWFMNVKMCLQMSLPMLMCGHQTKWQTIQNHLFSSCRKWELRWDHRPNKRICTILYTITGFTVEMYVTKECLWPKCEKSTPHFSVHVYFANPKCIFLTRYQKHSLNKSHM